jgi:hypothetical protein
MSSDSAPDKMMIMPYVTYDYLAGPDGDIWSDVDLVGIDSGDFASGIDDGFDFDSDFYWL